MIRLKSLLNESRHRRSDSIKESEAIDLYNKFCSNHYLQNQKIYRGIDAGFDYAVVDPSLTKRSSIGEGGNQYTLLLDNFSSWSSFPKRSRSIICSSSRDTAYAYGQVYIVIPFDGAEIAIAPSNDIWYSFGQGMDEYLDGMRRIDLQELTTGINILYGYTQTPTPDVYDDQRLNNENFSALKKQFKIIDKNKELIATRMKQHNKKSNFTFIAKKVLEALQERGASLMSLLENLMDPALNGFQLKKYKAGFRTPKKDNEIWTDYQSLLIAEDKYYDFIEQIKS